MHLQNEIFILLSFKFTTCIVHIIRLAFWNMYIHARSEETSNLCVTRYHIIWWWEKSSREKFVIFLHALVFCFSRQIAERKVGSWNEDLARFIRPLCTENLILYLPLQYKEEEKHLKNSEILISPLLPRSHFMENIKSCENDVDERQ